jgi:hypothetical protein
VIVTSNREQLRESLSICSAQAPGTELAQESGYFNRPQHNIQHAPVPNIEHPVSRHEISIRHDIPLGL